MKRTLFSLTLLVAILIASLAFASDAMTGEPDYLAEAQKIAAEIQDDTFVTWDGTTYLRWQETILQIRNPLEYEITDSYAPELSKSGILNRKKFQYNFSLEWEGIPILLLLNGVL
jgi:hypothetical protein